MTLTSVGFPCWSICFYVALPGTSPCFPFSSCLLTAHFCILPLHDLSLLFTCRHAVASAAAMLWVPDTGAQRGASPNHCCMITGRSWAAPSNSAVLHCISSVPVVTDSSVLETDPNKLGANWCCPYHVENEGPELKTMSDNTNARHRLWVLLFVQPAERWHRAHSCLK